MDLKIWIWSDLESVKTYYGCTVVAIATTKEEAIEKILQCPENHSFGGGFEASGGINKPKVKEELESRDPVIEDLEPTAFISWGEG